MAGLEQERIRRVLQHLGMGTLRERQQREQGAVFVLVFNCQPAGAHGSLKARHRPFHKLAMRSGSFFSPILVHDSEFK